MMVANATINWGAQDAWPFITGVLYDVPLPLRRWQIAYTQCKNFGC